MLVVTAEQMTILGQHRQRAFHAQLAAHGREHFPAQFEGLPSPALEALVASIVERAATHQLSTERDISKYFNLACIFGLAFDKDPSLPWATAILDDPRLGATLQINRLYLTAVEHAAEGRGLHAVAQPVTAQVLPNDHPHD